MDELTDAQWVRIRPRLPRPKKRGRPRADDRQTIHGILWVLRSGARWWLTRPSMAGAGWSNAPSVGWPTSGA